jgi:hypothetical protein
MAPAESKARVCRHARRGAGRGRLFALTSLGWAKQTRVTVRFLIQTANRPMFMSRTRHDAFRIVIEFSQMDPSEFSALYCTHQITFLARVQQGKLRPRGTIFGGHLKSRRVCGFLHSSGRRPGSHRVSREAWVVRMNFQRTCSSSGPF